tara:strand:+ start:52 stop:183 length:132 start_codon:yes stop_codon:yes gene_type:complete
MVCTEQPEDFDNSPIFIIFPNKLDYIVTIGFIVKAYKLIGDKK